MLNDEQLGDLLHGELQARAGDIQPSAELLARLGAIEQGELSRSVRPTRRLPRPRVIGSVALASVVLVVAVIALGGSSPSRAFAITTSANGSVVLTLDDLTGIAGANAKLSQLGVRARVVPMTPGCATQLSLSYMGIEETPAPTITLIPNEIAPSATVVLAAEQVAPSRVEMAIGKVIGHVPPCVSSSGTGPGLSAAKGLKRTQAGK